MRPSVDQVPEAADWRFLWAPNSIPSRGRGGDGRHARSGMTPWGEIAFQLGGAEASNVLRKPRAASARPRPAMSSGIPAARPSGPDPHGRADELHQPQPQERPVRPALSTSCTTCRKTARGRDNVVLVVSIPASELEMKAEDQSDYDRFKKMLDRLGKPVMMAAEAETSEIIRRRLFEWDQRAMSPGRAGHAEQGRSLRPATNMRTGCWIIGSMFPAWFPVDDAREAVLRDLPVPSRRAFRLRAQMAIAAPIPADPRRASAARPWVSHAYQSGFKGAHRDRLIGMGTAPLDDPLFRACSVRAARRGSPGGCVTTDIVGKPDSFAMRLDSAAVETIKKARLHRKVATSIFFESSGGQQPRRRASPEIRLAVGEPNLDMGNVETVLEALQTNCYYLTTENNRYRFSLRRISTSSCPIAAPTSSSHASTNGCRSEIQKVFADQAGVERVFFPERSNQVPDRPVITLIVLAPEQGLEESETVALCRAGDARVRQLRPDLQECADLVPSRTPRPVSTTKRGSSWPGRTSRTRNRDRLDETQRHQLAQSLKKAERDLREAVWRTYKNVWLLGRDNAIRTIDLGLVHSSAADSLAGLILRRLRQDDEAVDSVNRQLPGPQLAAGADGVEHQGRSGRVLRVTQVPAAVSR